MDDLDHSRLPDLSQINVPEQVLSHSQQSQQEEESVRKNLEFESLFLPPTTVGYGEPVKIEKVPHDVKPKKGF